mgnify:CR=1 FL=1
MLESEVIQNFPVPITIAVVGTHYSGKTTLCNLLGRSLTCEVIEERWSDSPFLQNQETDLLPNQLWHLFQASSSLMRAKYLNTRGINVLLDTLPQSNYIFSRNSLNDADFSVFERIYEAVMCSLPMPDLLIYLSAGTRFLYEQRRIQRIRGGFGPETDKTVDYAWLDSSRALHEEMFGTWSLGLSVNVNIERVDFVNKQDDLEGLISNMKLKMNGFNQRTL